MELDGRRALVTGSTRGIGREIALRLSRQGVRVVVHGRDEAAGRETLEEIRDAGGEGRFVAGDLATPRGAEGVAAVAAEAWDGIDILVNNAGGFEVCDWWAASPERWERTYRTSVVSIVGLVQRLAPDMVEGGWGRVIQVASVSATLAPPPFPDYAAAKAAALNLTVSLAKTLEGSGVTVNTVSPGPVDTPTWRSFAQQLAEGFGWKGDIEDTKRRLLEGPMRNPVGRIGRPADIAPLVTFLASPLAGFVNAANIRVDGGLSGFVH